MSNEIKSIDSLGIFSAIPQKEIIPLFSLLTQKKLKQDEILLKKGDPINSLYIVMTGELRAEMHLDGISFPVCNIDKEGLFGVLLKEKNHISDFTIVANEPTTVLIINEKSIALLKPPVKERLLYNIQSLDYSMNNNLMALISRLGKQVSQLQSFILDEYNENRKYTLEATALQDAIKKIPSLPSYTYELAGLLTKETISTDRVVEHIKSDPSLMALVLKVVNSPMYNLSQKVTDFHHAVMLLGFAQIYQIVIDNSLNNVMPNKPEFIEIRDRALMVSTLSFEIAMACGFDRPLVLSTIGTLHIIGTVVKMLLKKDAEFAETYMLYDDAVIASEVLRNWRMPEMIYKTINYYKFPNFVKPSELPPDIMKMVSILHLAIVSFDVLKANKGKLSPFIEGYIRSLNLAGSIDEIIIKRIIPNLKKRFEMLPKTVQLILKENKLV